jgi:hypothetical protein
MVTLQTSDQPTTGAALAIIVDGEVWAATLNLLQQLLDGN